ncbi:MAG TPA: PTS sugar transporter subunit IIC [Longimicrobiaceae bacterium]|nr:PTS sugar transporter subunit IIC [Longimicrobiaceae bacterium]
MLPEPGVYLLLLLLGGWIALDGASFGQAMVSRPIVAATLAGWLVGSPVLGAAIGLVLEVFHLTVLPVGAARYPEAGPAAVVGGASFAIAGPTPSALLTATLFVLAWEWVGGASMRYLRQVNMRIAAVTAHPGMSPGELERRHIVSMMLDFFRGAVLVGGGIPLLTLVLVWTRVFWGLPEEVTRLAVASAVTALLASAFRLFGGGIKLFLIGASCGLLYLILG